MISPALEKYAQGTVFGDLWKRPGLSVRDRSVVTLAALITRNQTVEMPFYLNVALDNGVKPAEISEIITHLAFYSGWGNAMSAVAVAKDVFAERKIAADQLPVASPNLLALNEAAEADRPSGSATCSAPSFRAWCSTRRMFCSATCGYVPALRRATGASSRSARWSRPGRSLSSPAT